MDSSELGLPIYELKCYEIYNGYNECGDIRRSLINYCCAMYQNLYQAHYVLSEGFEGVHLIPV